jgi:hypothetical protein
MILGSKHVGAILNVLVQIFYVCALVGVLIKWEILSFFYKHTSDHSGHHAEREGSCLKCMWENVNL